MSHHSANSRNQAMIAILCIVSATTIANAQTGVFVGSQSLSGGVGVNGGSLLVNTDADPTLETYPIPIQHWIDNVSNVEFRTDSSASVMYIRAFGSALAASCQSGKNQVYFYRIVQDNDTGGHLEEIYNEDLCVNGPSPDHDGVFASAGQIQHVAYIVEPSDSAASTQRMHFFNLNGFDEHQVVLLNDEIDNPFLFSPDGTLAFMKHGLLIQPTEADYTLIDLCGGARFGQALQTFNNLSAAPDPVAEIIEISPGNGQFRVRISHPDIGAMGVYEDDVIPCAGVMGACCVGASCAQTSNANCAGTFSPNQPCAPNPCATPVHTLSITRTGNGTGFVQSTNPIGVSCGSTCDLDVDEGTTVTLIANPNFDSVFAGWSGACTGSASSTQVTVNADINCNADFALKQADLSVEIADNADPVIAGNPLGYTVTASNLGPDAANSVIVSVTLPPEYNYSSCSPSLGTCVENGGTLTWNVFTLSPSASATLTISGNVAGDARGQLSAAVDVVGNELDPNGINDSAAESTSVDVVVDLSINNEAEPALAPQGGHIVYTSYVTNSGPSDATGVIVDAVLPAGVTTLDGRGSPTMATPLTCNVGTIPAGETVPVAIFVRIDPSLMLGTLMNNAATVSTADPESDLSNNNANVSASVVEPLNNYAVAAFHRLVDETTPIPDSTGTFEFFGTPTIGRNDEMAFNGGRTGLQGAYRYDAGNLERILDTTQPLPSSFGTRFDSFTGQPSVDGTDVAYTGFVPVYAGHYARLNGLNQLIGRIVSTVLPGSPGTLGNWSAGELDNGNIVFYAVQVCGFEGVYRWRNGALEAIADRNTPLPGAAGTFTSFINCLGNQYGPSNRDGMIAFLGNGSNDNQGVYYHAAGLRRIADRTTADSDGRTFELLGPPVTDRGLVAFAARASDVPGVYLRDCLGVHTIVDTSTTIPGTTETFDRVGGFFGPGAVQLDRGNIVFYGANSDFSIAGWFGYYQGRIFRIALSGENVGGEPLFPLFSRRAMNGNRLAFTNLGAMNQRAIYVAEFGEIVVTLGDMNCDGAINVTDLPLFSLALVDANAYAAAQPTCNIENADMNQDGFNDGRDIALLMITLLNP